MPQELAPVGCLLCAALSAYLYVEISLFFPLYFAKNAEGLLFPDEM